MMRWIDVGLVVGALTAIGVGTWWHDPGAALVTIGGLVFALVVGWNVLQSLKG